MDLEFGPEIMDTLEEVIERYKNIRNKESIQYISKYIPEFHPGTILISNENIYEDIESQETDYTEIDLDAQMRKLDLIYFRLPINKDQFEIEELRQVFPQGRVSNDRLTLNGLKIGFLNKRNLLELIWHIPDRENYVRYLNITLSILDKVFDYCKQKQYLHQ